MFKRILVPLDLTEKNESAVATALELALQNAASVSLLHVVELVEHIPQAELASFYDHLERTARAGMASWAEKLRAKGLYVATDVVYGRRTEEIVKYSLANESDLIVLSSHKLGPESSVYSLGTISHKVAMVAQCHVLLVK